MKVLLRPNFDKTGSMECTRDTMDKLLELGMLPMMDEKRATEAEICSDSGCKIGRFEELLRECDILLTIGGDGTILHAVQASLRSGKPLLGINTGRIGFLTQLESNELEHLALLKKGSYGILRRMMLEATLTTPKEEKVFTALNDIVITRGDSNRLAEIEIVSGGAQVARHRADGMILATPTGSTAYSLSAGSSVAYPSLELILMTAICSHSHFNHSIILSPEEEYLVRQMPGGTGQSLQVNVDGSQVGRLEGDGCITIRRAPVSADFIDLRLRDFYSCVDEKLALGGRF